MKKAHNFKTPSEFYRIRRPYNFSDSQTIREVELPKEILAFELEKITTNQKENDFETLCRKLAEKLIAPNLIPQVGPTGGEVMVKLTQKLILFRIQFLKDGLYLKMVGIRMKSGLLQ